MDTSIKLRLRRKLRQRFKISKVINGRCRLLVHRTNNHIYAQILNGLDSKVVAHVSTLSKDAKKIFKNGSNKVAAEYVGKMIALKAIEQNISNVVFDRSGYLYHGRIKTLAESARKNGLNF